ncbi:hypothetical protein QFC21_003822 [Naganishia friedmannii]|uniref:Uncharacterized protein n=1 Tax=Naganishia friedmannii TaxID=89922 RepID=A0ACC2VLN3_9TREE|nr:hypothetical protein QFC21_003822 [Naganishia friedmannii]
MATLSYAVHSRMLSLFISCHLAPVDDPTEHQGRSRSRRWIEGDWNAHVYLKLKVSAALRAVLNDTIQQAQDELSKSGYPYMIHSLYDTSSKGPRSASPSTFKEHVAPPPSTQKELHISLTHPLPLRIHQVPLLLDHIKATTNISSKTPIKPFQLGLDCRVVGYRNGMVRASALQSPGRSFSTVDPPDSLESSADDLLVDSFGQDDAEQDRNARDVLDGLGKTGVGRGGRAFLALRVRAGHDKLEHIQSQIIDPFLRVHHLPTYHSQPEFHTSFAWVLVPAQDLESSAVRPAHNIPHMGDPFTEQLLQRLEERLSEALLNAQPRGGWLIDGLSTKIGRTVRDFPFAGAEL